ncbi:MAG: serine dehydratase subunit alpha family protein [Clostridia bacterium]|nr:serine dehydratase subunit alpha family protein [Clostridia bacterium]
MEPLYNTYTKILREEIMPSTGCTEPAAVAYCAAKAHRILGMQPTAVTVSVSAGILKNAKSVVVPNTNGLKGIRAAVAAGIICGNPDKGMHVIGTMSEEQRFAVVNFMESVHVDVSCAETDCPLYISVTLYARTSYSRVVIANSYSNIVEIMKNGEVLLKRPIAVQSDDSLADRSYLNLHDIYVYADCVDLAEVRDLLDMQIEYNTAISSEGLQNNYGSNIGKILMGEHASDAKTCAKAYAAAGCDARMSGCELPVASLCGSASQGITAALPVIYYARHYKIDANRLYRALILADLLTVYQKKNAEQLCGAVYAGCAAGAGIAYLLGGEETVMTETFMNATAIASDMVCDGAKPSCAAKVAAAVEAGILGYQMYLYRSQP